MVKLSSVALDPGKVADGVDADFYGIKLRVRYAGNHDYEAEVTRLSRAHRVRGPAAEQAVREIQDEALAKHVLVGWSDMDDDEGKSIPYSWQRARELLSDDRHRPLRDFVVVVANDETRYRENGVAAAAGN